jgi:hypothetical protein
MQIKKICHVCDGYDINIDLDSGEQVVWHFQELPKDLEAKCAELEQEKTARETVTEDDLELQKTSLLQEKQQLESLLSEKTQKIVEVEQAISIKVGKICKEEIIDSKAVKS